MEVKALTVSGLPMDCFLAYGPKQLCKRERSFLHAARSFVTTVEVMFAKDCFWVRF